MAGEVILLNPRRRRRRKKAVRRAHAARPVRRRRRRRAVALNPRRRRSHRRARARGHRRVHRNPSLFGINMGTAVSGVLGYVGTRYATGFALRLIPAEWQANPQTAPLVRIGVKAVVGIVAPRFLSKFIGRSIANGWMAGGVIAVGVDIFETFIAPMIPVQMADYEQGALSDYEPGLLSDTEAMPSGSSVYGGGIYG